MIHILTASHIENEKRLDQLLYMIESFSYYNIQIIHHISFSTDIEFSIKKLYTFTSKNQEIFVYPQESNIPQFEHFYSILKNYPFKYHDLIMFFNDDCILLELPKEILSKKHLIGYQYSHNRLEYNSKRVGTILNELKKYEFIWEKNIDLSGCTITHKYIEKFFYTKVIPIMKELNTQSDDISNKLNVILFNLLDVQLVEYLNTLGPVKPISPFVYCMIPATKSITS